MSDNRIIPTPLDCGFNVAWTHGRLAVELDSVIEWLRKTAGVNSHDRAIHEMLLAMSYQLESLKVEMNE